MDSQVINQGLTTLLQICEVVIPFGAFCYAFYKGKGVEFIKSKIGLIQDQDTRELVSNAFDRVDTLLDTEMSALETTVKPQLLKDIAEGNLTKEALKDLGIQAVKTVMTQLPDKSKELLAQEVNDLELYVNKRLEKLLGDAKLNPQSVIQKTVLPEIPQEEIDNEALKTQLAQIQIQLQSIQVDRDNLNQQLSQVQSDKTNVEQANQQLINQVNDLTNQKAQVEADKQNIQAKLDSIQSAVSQVVQPNNNVNIDSVTSNDTTDVINNVVDAITNQAIAQ
jgi:chromosome segregation ATPase